MEDFEISKSYSSLRRDSSFFMCKSEDIDYDETDESRTSKNTVYCFSPNPSLLVSNKGQTRRSDWEKFFKSDEGESKQSSEVSSDTIKSLLSVSINHEPHSNKCIKKYNCESMGCQKHTPCPRCASVKAYVKFGQFGSYKDSCTRLSSGFKQL